MSLQALVENNVACVKRMEQIAPILCQWFDAELMELHRAMPQDHGGLLMGAPVWGDAYIRRMALYSLPTLGGDRNIQALAGRCWLVLYGAAGERPHLWKITRWLRQMGVRIIWRDIPDELIALAMQTPEDRYGLLACTQNLLAHMAGHAGMGLHMYMPDHLYCDGYFERLLALAQEHPAIVQQGVSVNAATAPADIEAWRDPSGVLAIPPRDLGALALKHMHPRSSMLMVNGAPPGLMPDSRQVSWKGRDALHIADPCQNLAYLAPALCLDAPIAFTSTLDMLAPEYIPPGSWHMARPEDGLVFCELSDASRIPPPAYVDMDRFLLRAWAQVAFTEDYMEYFKRRCLVPIPEQDDGISDEAIAQHHEAIVQAMYDGKKTAMEVYFAGNHPSRW